MSARSARDPDKVDLIDVSRVLWKRRLSILATAIVGAAIGFATGVVVIKHRAESFLQLSYTAPITALDEKQDKEGKDLRFRTNIAEYKVLSAAVLGREGFLEYAANGRRLDPELIRQLNGDLARQNLLARWVRPVFAMARADLRDIPEQPREEANYLVGMEIGVERRSPEEALAIATALGQFARDSAILLRAREFATGLFYKASSRTLDLERQIIATRLALAQAEEKQKELTIIRNRYPDAARSDVRQVISVDRTTSRYLPPVAQLVGTESQIAEFHETLRVSEWEIERAKALMAFLDPAQRVVRDALSGNDMFPALDKLLAETFDAKRLTADPWRDAFNSLRIEIFGLKTLYFERMRFISRPALDEIPLSSRLGPALLGLLAGAVIAMLVILIRLRFARTPANAE